MNVSDICQKNVVTARPIDDLTTVAKLMREKHVGYIVVAEPGAQNGTVKPAGVVTDRDIVVSVVAAEAEARTLRVEDVMTREPAVAQHDESLGSALQKMRHIGVRRLPVLGERGELIGVLSMDDIIDALVGELQDVAGAIRSEQLVEHSLRP